MQDVIERNVDDPVLGSCVVRVDAVLAGPDLVKTLQRLAKELEESPMSEPGCLLFLWESLIIRRVIQSRTPAAWWSPQNQFTVEKRNIAPSVGLDLRRASGWVTARSRWETERFHVLVALRDDERGGICS